MGYPTFPETYSTEEFQEAIRWVQNHSLTTAAGIVLDHLDNPQEAVRVLLLLASAVKTG